MPQVRLAAMGTEYPFAPGPNTTESESRRRWLAVDDRLCRRCGSPPAGPPSRRRRGQQQGNGKYGPAAQDGRPKEAFVRRPGKCRSSLEPADAVPQLDLGPMRRGFAAREGPSFARRNRLRGSNGVICSVSKSSVHPMPSGGRGRCLRIHGEPDAEHRLGE
jgi:hypothetical protein